MNRTHDVFSDHKTKYFNTSLFISKITIKIHYTSPEETFTTPTCANHKYIIIRSILPFALAADLSECDLPCLIVHSKFPVISEPCYALKVFFRLHLSLALLLCYGLWGKRSSHTSGFCAYHYLWRSDWLKLFGQRAAQNPLLVRYSLSWLHVNTLTTTFLQPLK